MFLTVVITIAACVKYQPDSQAEFLTPQEVMERSPDYESFDVGAFHNDLMAVGMGNLNEPQYKSLMASLTDAQADAKFFEHVAMAKQNLESSLGISLNSEVFAKGMYNAIKKAKALPNSTLTDSYLTEIGATPKAREILLSAQSVIATYPDNPATVETQINDLRNNLNLISNEVERSIINKSLDLFIATNLYWNQKFPTGLNPSGRVHLTAAQQADVVGFCTGAYEGIKIGAVAGGGVPGAVVMGFAMGAGYALGASMWTHFMPNAWWNPFA